MKAAILNDLTRCIGCESCVWACKEANGLSRDAGASRLDAETFTHLERRGDLAVRRQCMHCEAPTCASVCPVGAFTKTAAGPVVYDADRCIGCRYCMVACPFDVPRYEWDQAVPRVRKCEMCFEARVSRGEQPACTQVCPTGATLFGDRDALVREARRRIRTEPERYVDHVYGLREAGGTRVLYLSPVPFEALGFQVPVAEAPYPELTWRVLSKLPNVVSVAGVGIAGLWWLIQRREEVARVEGGDNRGGTDASPRGDASGASKGDER